MGGELVVEDKKITSTLDEQLSTKRYQYPKQAYNTVNIADNLALTPELPTEAVTANVIRTELPGITLPHVQLRLEPRDNWQAHFREQDLCFVSVVERYGKSGAVAHGLLQNFGIASGAVASSVGHDAHNLIVAGTNEDDMQLAVRTIKEHSGGVVVVDKGEVKALVELPVAGLLSDKRATEVAAATSRLKKAWAALGCTLPYMGFNLIPLSVIPEIRITDKGLVTVPQMEQLALFEPVAS